MYRISRRLPRWLPQMVSNRTTPSPGMVRNLSGVKVGMSRGVQVAASTTALTLSLVGTTLVVANKNEELRAILEGVPGAGDILDAILGERVKDGEVVMLVEAPNEAIDQQEGGLDLVMDKISLVESDEAKVDDNVAHSEAEPDVPVAETVAEDVPEVADKVVLEETETIECHQQAIETIVNVTESEVLVDKIEQAPPEIKDAGEEVKIEDTKVEISTPTIVEEVALQSDGTVEIIVDSSQDIKEEVKDVPKLKGEEKDLVEEIVTEAALDDTVIDVKIKEEVSTDEVVAESPIETEAIVNDVVTETPIDENTSIASIDEAVTEVKVEQEIKIDETKIDEVLIEVQTDEVVTEGEIEKEAAINEHVAEDKIDDVVTETPAEEVVTKHEVIAGAQIDKVVTEVEVEKEDVTIDKTDELVKEVLHFTEPGIVLAEGLMALKETLMAKETVTGKLEENLEVKDTSKEDIPEAPSEPEQAESTVASIAGVALAAVLVTGADIAADIMLLESRHEEAPTLPVEPAETDSKDEVLSEHTSALLNEIKKKDDPTPESIQELPVINKEELINEEKSDTDTLLDQTQGDVISEKTSEGTAEGSDTVVIAKSMVDVPSIEVTQEKPLEESIEDHSIGEKAPIKEEVESVPLISEEIVAEALNKEQTTITMDEIVEEVRETKSMEDQEIVVEKEVIDKPLVNDAKEEVIEIISPEPIKTEEAIETIVNETEPEVFQDKLEQPPAEMKDVEEKLEQPPAEMKDVEKKLEQPPAEIKNVEEKLEQPPAEMKDVEEKLADEASVITDDVKQESELDEGIPETLKLDEIEKVEIPKIDIEATTDIVKEEAMVDEIKEDLAVQEESKITEEEVAPLETASEQQVDVQKVEVKSDNTASKLNEAFHKLGVKVDEAEKPIAVEDELVEHSALLKESNLEIESKNDKVSQKDDTPLLVIRSVTSNEEEIESSIPTFVEKITNPDVQLSLMNGAGGDVNGVADDAHVEIIEGASDSEGAKSDDSDKQTTLNEAKVTDETLEPEPVLDETPSTTTDTLEEVTTEELKEPSSIATDTIQEETTETTKKEPIQEEIVHIYSEIVHEEPIEEVREKDEEILPTSVVTVQEESSENEVTSVDDSKESVQTIKDTPVVGNEIENIIEETTTTVEEKQITDDQQVKEEQSTASVLEEKPLEESTTEEPHNADDDFKADKPLEELAVEELVAVVQDTTQELDNLQETLIDEMEKTAGLAMKVLKLQEDIVKQQKIDREKYTNELEDQKQEMLEEIRVKTEELLVQREAIEHMYVEELEGMKSTYEETLDKKEQDHQTKFVEKGEEYQKNLEEQKKELESVMRKHIGRQAAAHHEHLEEQLQTTEKEQERRHSTALTSSLASARAAYATELAGLEGRLDGLEAGLVERGSADTEVVVAQQLWLACRDLVDAVSGGEGKLPAWEQGVQTVGEHILNVQAVKSGDEFISAVLHSLPSAVHERGVYSEAALKFRFNRVEKAASRVALVGEHGGTPLQHLLSIITSSLMVNTVDSHEAEYVGGEMRQMELIWRARYCVNNGDMGMAVQYMNQLKGDAALVARDWVEETRMLLETQLAASALMSYATSVAMEVLPAEE